MINLKQLLKATGIVASAALVFLALLMLTINYPVTVLIILLIVMICVLIFIVYICIES